MIRCQTSDHFSLSVSVRLPRTVWGRTACNVKLAMQYQISVKPPSITRS